jgi:hypothetical protein
VGKSQARQKRPVCSFLYLFSDRESKTSVVNLYFNLKQKHFVKRLEKMLLTTGAINKNAVIFPFIINNIQHYFIGRPQIPL